MRAIESVINQSFSNWELLIIDDGSEDNTDQLIKEITDSRIRYFKKKHEERSIARNYGIAKAKGEYLCFLDSDDYFLENHLKLHFENISKLNFPIAAFYSGSYMESNLVKKKDIHLFANEKPFQNLWKHGFNLLPFSFHKDIFKDIQMDPKLVFMEDIDLLLEIFKRFEIFPIYENTNVIVVHEQRSTAECYKSELKKYGNMYIFSIDTIIKNHHDFLRQYVSEKEIQDKKGEILLNFLKAGVKNIDPSDAFYFAKKYIKWKSNIR